MSGVEQGVTQAANNQKMSDKLVNSSQFFRLKNRSSISDQKY